MKSAILIGNSDGIGASTTRKLLELEYKVVGISKSSFQSDSKQYTHILADVTSNNYRQILETLTSEIDHIDLCIYFAGIGDELNINNLPFETKVFEVNLMSAVISTEIVLKKMISQRQGHFIGLSSVADALVSPESPSYSASKSGVSKFWEGLGLALKSIGVNVSNIRFGFVNTKMAKSPIKPFEMSVDEASDFILKIIERPKIRATKPKKMLPLIWILGFITKIKIILTDFR